MPASGPHALLVRLLLLLLVAGPPGAAHAASDFERYTTAAARLHESLEYELALEQIARARNVARGLEEDVTLSLYEGIMLAELSEWDKARAQFLAALLLKPEATLPLRVAPKVEREFEALRVRARKQLARGQPPQTPAPSKPPVATRPPAATPSAPSPAPTPPPVVARTDRPEQKPAQETRLTPSAPSAPSLPSPALVETPTRPGRVVPLALLGAGVAAAGAGTWFGLSSRAQVASAYEAHYQSDALSFQTQAQRSALTANVLFGTAGLAAAGALVSWLLLPSSATPAPQEVR